MVPPAALPPRASIFSEEHKSLQLAIYNSSYRQNPATRSWANTGADTSSTLTAPPRPAARSNNALQLRDTAEGEEMGSDRSWLRLGSGRRSSSTAGKEESQGGEGTCPRPRSKAVAKPGCGRTLLCHRCSP